MSSTFYTLPWALFAVVAVTVPTACTGNALPSDLKQAPPLTVTLGSSSSAKPFEATFLAPFRRLTKPAHRDHRRSWIAPAAKTQNLLYISDDGTNDVYVYSWPKGRLLGTLRGFSYPQGECVDRKGDVWIADKKHQASQLDRRAVGLAT